MATPPAAPTIDPAAYRRSLIAAAVPTLAVPVVLGGLMLALGVTLRVGPFVAGAVGWLIALMLRAPVAIVAMRVRGDQRHAQPWITASSGPLEEGVRLVTLLLVGRDLDTAASVGLGWAAIEVIYSLINGVAVLSLVGRDDAEAQQVRALMPLSGALEPSAPWWGVVERITASVASNRASDPDVLGRFEATLAVVAAVVLAVAIALWMPR